MPARAASCDPAVDGDGVPALGGEALGDPAGLRVAASTGCRRPRLSAHRAGGRQPARAPRGCCPRRARRHRRVRRPVTPMPWARSPSAVPTASGRPWPERAAGDLHARHQVAVGMVAQRRVEACPAGQPVLRDEALGGERGVVGHRSVALGEIEAVAARITDGLRSRRRGPGRRAPRSRRGSRWPPPCASRRRSSSPSAGTGRRTVGADARWSSLSDRSCRHGTMEQVEVHLKSRQISRRDHDSPSASCHERSGVATSAIRFYESRGLIHSVRTTGNQRRYEQSTLRRVAFIRAAQRVGLSLEEIGEALATLPENRTPTKADWARLSRTWRPRLDEQIERIERLRDKLDQLHRLRLPEPEDLRALQPRRYARRPGTGPGHPRTPGRPDSRSHRRVAQCVAPRAGSSRPDEPVGLAPRAGSSGPTSR